MTLSKSFRRTGLVLALAASFTFSAGCAGSRPADLGAKSGRLLPCPDSPNCVSSAAEDEVHSIQALLVRKPVPEVWAALEGVLESLPRVEIVRSEDSGNRYLHAEFTSPLMRYVDDVEFVGAGQGRDTRIEVRSASRIGYGDLGANRERIELIRTRLAEKGFVAR